MKTSLYTTIKQIVTNLQVVIIPTDNKRPHSRAGRTIKHFWVTPPTQTQLDRWFTDGKVKSYAILCGKISGNLFILDFDNKQAYQNFKRQFPQIAKTFTVKTRRGYHVYLRSEKTIHTQKIKGGDLLGESAYAIGPGSTVKQKQYIVNNQQPIYHLQTKELNQLLPTLRQPSRDNDLSTPSTYISLSDFTPQTIIKKFQMLAPKQGRNQALYQMASTARALKIPLENIQDPLSRAYANERAHWAHLPETQTTRLREAIRTLKSAYHNKRNLINSYQTTNTGKLPTALREEMLKATAVKNKHGLLIKSSTLPGRLLEALLIEDIKSGETLTIRKAQEIGSKYKISAKGIYQILRQEKGITPTGEKLFRIATYIPPVRESDNKTIKKHYKPSGTDHLSPFSDQSTSKARTKGRQTQFMFVMPSIEELCGMYNVIPQSWDDLDPSDLMSAKAYKEAIHREYIRRCSPEQSVTYMANRLGCHPRSIYRYDSNLNVKAIPIFGFIPLTWSNVDDSNLYSDRRTNGITPGKWLQRTDGKRFPSIKGVALRQLAQGKTLIACERRPSKRLLSPSASTMPLFDVIWRRSDLPVGEWDVGGSPYVLPALGPHITPLPLADLPKARVEILETFVVPEYCHSDTTSETSISTPLSENLPIPHPSVDRHLTIVPGIGQSRCDKLFDLGIFTLSELVKADPQRLAGVHWYGGYVTLKTILHWQEEAAILLGWQKRDPEVYAIREYRKYLKSLMKYVDKTFTLINSIFPIDDLSEIEPTRTYLKLKSLDHLSKQKHSRFYETSYKVELDRLASDFFIFYREYIEGVLSLQDWELEDYGFGDRGFWKRQYTSLERMESKFCIPKFV